MDDLWRRYKKDRDPKDKEALVKRYLPLVKYVVGRMPLALPPGLSFDDVLSFGIMGLLDAIERYDLTLGYKFNTFAVPRIRGAVLDELRRFDWLSRAGREKIRRLEKAVDKLYREKGQAGDVELMDELDMDEKTYKELLEVASRNHVVSLDEVLALDDGDVSRGDLIADDLPTPQEAVELSDELDSIARALERLSEKERLVISLYYYDGLTLKEIGAVLGVTESRASQIHGKALSTLRALLRAGF
ncbi:MAG TPA: FliA/WhiG family RNA polymerase sigma factor [Thermosynergistes sp.]|nr:MAG: RNA polymerase sigma factor [Synergistales bacterium 54_24]HAF49626.1 FliA/WhiG family RNA polymerase sigma factor [Synergistaceae bacterium]HHV52487.1 FliA/WhiG family RNA polymerase sigma factor [Synergistaceae bacterium]HQE22126.1 FliA/WhiG family RNA polymerase sigma factor [Thermosynergistes sp.]